MVKKMLRSKFGSLTLCSLLFMYHIPFKFYSGTQGYDSREGGLKLLGRELGALKQSTEARSRNGNEAVEVPQTKHIYGVTKLTRWRRWHSFGSSEWEAFWASPQPL